MNNITQEYIVGNSVSVSTILQKYKLPAPNLIISSPPYFDLINYDNNKGQIGYGSTNYDTFLDTITDIYQQCYDSSAEDASFWLVVDTFKKEGERKLYPFDIVNKLKENQHETWNLRDIIIWDKGKNLPWNQKGNFKNQHEYILFFTKGEKYKFHVDRLREITDLKKWWKTYPERYNPDGKAPSNVWNYITPIQGWGENNQDHFCPFPFPLVEKIISLSSDEKDFIFDPFAGSGSVLAMSKLMNRHSAGIDINETYKGRFESQVIIGAKTYWKRRVKEIEETNTLLKNFKETNLKLRKMKVANSISEYINKKNEENFLMFAKDSLKNNIDLYFYTNDNVPNIIIEDKTLLKLIHQCKVKVTIRILNPVDLQNFLANEVIYKYRIGKFFRYTCRCDNNTVVNNASRFEYIYSNISIKVPND
jgi:DNA modification methylase